MMAERKPFLLRISPGLWEELEVWAADELRSVNGQIEYLLRQATVQSGRAPRRDHAGGGGPPGKGPDEHTRS